MSNSLSLTALELRSLYGINKFRHTKDKKEKNRYRLLLVAWIIVFLAVVSYIGGVVFGLYYLGISSLAPSYLAVISALIVFVFGLFRSGQVMFKQNGYDILSSIPIKAREIVFSRFVSLYLEDLILTACIMLSGLTVFAVLEKPSFPFYLFSFIGILFLPIIPSLASLLFGTLITAISTRAKHKSLIQTILLLILVVAMVILPFGIQNLEEITPEKISALMSNISELFGKLYTPSVWFGNAVLEIGYFGFICLLLVSSVAVILCFFILNAGFHKIMRGLQNVTANHDYKIGKMERRGLIKSLYLREFKRYFSSSVYVTNTILGPILTVVASIALFIMGDTKIQEAIPIGNKLNVLVPFAISAIFCLMTTTCTSISMEGKQIWVIKSLPIPSKALFDAKILLNLSFMLPCYALSEVFLILALKPTLAELVYLLIIPILIILFSTVLGITVNLKIHRFDWESEVHVVKQSASAALGGFSGTLVSLILGGLVFVTPSPYTFYIIAAICVLLSVITFILYRHNNKTKLESL